VTTAFPGAIDNFTNPTATDLLDSVTVPHAAQHANINDAVEAIETAIGTTGAPVLAPIASPTFTGVPAAPTASLATNTTQLATTAFVIANAGGAVSFGFTSGLYYRGMNDYGSQVTSVVSQTVYVPFVINETKTFDRIAIQSSPFYVGTGAVRMGIYNNDSTTGKPSTVLLDAGTVATTAAYTIYEITISQSLTAGAYWIAFNMQTAAATPRFLAVGVTASSASGFMVSTTGAINPNAGLWLEASITGAFTTAGTLTSATTGATCTLRAS